MTHRHVVVMLTTSYPRFPGDTIGTFMEPIARGIAARGHEVHVVLPWHPRLAREPVEDGVHFHPFRYAPHPDLNVFGYAAALAGGRPSARCRLGSPRRWRWPRPGARCAASRRRSRATLLHGHWIIPSGAVVTAAGRGLPLVVSLHGSDVYVAERHAVARVAAQAALRRLDWLTACSDDLRDRMIALGADARATTIPYGVDARGSGPTRPCEPRGGGPWAPAPGDLVLFTAGRFVRKKGFEYLIDAVARLAPRWPALRLVIGGGGDLEAELRARAVERGIADRVSFPGVLAQDEVAAYLAGADIAVVPSVRDEAGNVDGLPNTVMEALASGTALVATRVGGIPSVIEHGRTGWLVAGTRRRRPRGGPRPAAGGPARPRRARLGGARRRPAPADMGDRRRGVRTGIRSGRRPG